MHQRSGVHQGTVRRMGVQQRSGVLTGERGCCQEKWGGPEKRGGAPEKRGDDRRSGVLTGEMGC